MIRKFWNWFFGWTDIEDEWADEPQIDPQYITRIWGGGITTGSNDAG